MFCLYRFAVRYKIKTLQ